MQGIVFFNVASDMLLMGGHGDFSPGGNALLGCDSGIQYMHPADCMYHNYI